MSYTTWDKKDKGVLWERKNVKVYYGAKKRESVLKNRMYEGSYRSLHQLYKSAIWVLYS